MAAGVAVGQRVLPAGRDSVSFVLSGVGMTNLNCAGSRFHQMLLRDLAFVWKISNPNSILFV